MNASESLHATIDAIDPSVPFALIVRHSIREEIPRADPYADVDLTDEGVQVAKALGHRLASRLSWAATSPYLRCRRTAELVLGRAPEVDDRLGHPGPWVFDRRIGKSLFDSMGTHHVVRAQIEGRTLPGIRPLPEGTQLLASAALDRIAAGLGSGICVSHDAVLMPAIAFLTGDAQAERWLPPLDGFAIQSTDSGLLCVWRGERRIVARFSSVRGAA